MPNTLPPANEHTIVDKAFTQGFGPETERELAEQGSKSPGSQCGATNEEDSQDDLATSATSNAAAAVDKESQKLLQSALAVQNNVN